MPPNLSFLRPELVSTLVKDFGSPLFVLNDEYLASRASNMQEALQRAFSNSALYYSVKTNSTPSIVKSIMEKGIGLEIISGFEIDLIEKLVPKDDNRLIIVNGPYKSDAELKKIIKRNCLINSESLEEVRRIDAISHEQGKICPIGIRVNLSTILDSWNRFGIPVGKDLFQVCQVISRTMKNVRLCCLHCHIGGNIRDVNSFYVASQTLLDVAAKLRSSNGIKITKIDLGGGFPTDLPFGTDNIGTKIPQFTEFTEVIGKSFVHHEFSRKNDDLLLILEPGRALVDECVILLATVCSKIKNNKIGLVLDAGTNILPSAKYRRHDVSNLTVGKATNMSPYEIYGPLCMGSDVISSNHILPKTDVGDVLAISNAGAYSQSQSLNFIRYQPAIVQWSKNKIILVRRKQNFGDLFGRDFE